VAAFTLVSTWIASLRAGYQDHIAWPARPRPRSLAMAREMMLADRIALGARACG